MRTGDAEVEVWLEGAGGRSYLLFVQSQRQGPMDSKRWKRPRYGWHVERWQGDGDDDDGPNLVTRRKWAPTFQEAMRRARRAAEAIEAKR